MVRLGLKSLIAKELIAWLSKHGKEVKMMNSIKFYENGFYFLGILHFLLFWQNTNEIDPCKIWILYKEELD